MTKSESFRDDPCQIALIIIRITTLVLMVTLLSFHLRSLRVFKWEQSVSGGIAITYVIVAGGLTMCAALYKSGGAVFQIYLCGLGATLLMLNAFVLWRRWSSAGELTRAVIQFLIVLGMSLRRQIMLKVVFSALAALSLVTDFGLSLYLWQNQRL